MFLMPMHREGKGVEGRYGFVACVTPESTVEGNPDSKRGFTPKERSSEAFLVAVDKPNSFTQASVGKYCPCSSRRRFHRTDLYCGAFGTRARHRCMCLKGLKNVCRRFL